MLITNAKNYGNDLKSHRINKVYKCSESEEMGQTIKNNFLKIL